MGSIRRSQALAGVESAFRPLESGLGAIYMTKPAAETLSATGHPEARLSIVTHPVK